MSHNKGEELSRNEDVFFASQRPTAIAIWLSRASLVDLKEVVDTLATKKIYASFGVTPDEVINEAAE